MIIAGIDTAETAGNITNLLFTLCLLFCGVLVGPTALPGFWIFMYRVSPFTYLVEGILTASVAGAPLTCATNEFLHFDPPSGQSCGDYMAKYIEAAGGYLLDTNATSRCEFCQVKDTDAFLAGVGLHFSNAWRDFGLIFVYVGFNIVAALFIYWLARVPKSAAKRRGGGGEKKKK